MERLTKREKVEKMFSSIWPRWGKMGLLCLAVATEDQSENFFSSMVFFSFEATFMNYFITEFMNKKNWLKIQMIFFCIILLALLSFILLGNFLNWYLSKHLIRCSMESISDGTCFSIALGDSKYDNATATLLNRWQREYTNSRFFQFIIPNHLSFFAGWLTNEYPMKGMLEILFFIIYWMIILNIIFLLFLKIKKAVTNRYKIKDKNKKTLR